MYTFKLLNSDQEITDFERLLFATFSNLNPNNWLCQNYQLIDNNRYRAPFNYKYQLLFGAFSNETMVAGTALNTNTSDTMQLEKVGFNVSRQTLLSSGNFYEILNLGSREKNLKLLHQLRQYTFSHLKQRHVDYLVTTSSNNTLPFYRRYGCTIMESKTTQTGEKKYLLRLNVN